MNKSRINKKRINLLVLLIVLLSFLTHARNGAWESRVLLWADVIRKSPEKARAYNNAGVHYCRQKKYDLAIASTSKALSLDPHYTDAFINRGNAYDELGWPFKAIEDYTSALAIRPNDSYALYNRAAVYSRIGRTDKAIGDFMKSCKLGNQAGCEAFRRELEEKGRKEN